MMSQGPPEAKPSGYEMEGPAGLVSPSPHIPLPTARRGGAREGEGQPQRGFHLIPGRFILRLPWQEAIFWLLLAGLLAGFFFGEIKYLDFFGWVHDEGVYLTSARMVCAGHRLYEEVASLHPPLFISSLALTFKLFGMTLTAGRGMVLLLSLFALLGAALTAKELGRGVAGLAAAGMLAFSIPFYSVAARCLGDAPALGLASLALLPALRYQQEGKRHWLALAGLATAASLSYKLLAPFLVPLLALVWLLRYLALPPEERSKAWREAALLGGSLVLPALLIWFIWGGPDFYEQVIAFRWEARGAFPLDVEANLGMLWNFLKNNFGLAALALYGSIALIRKQERRAWVLIAWFALSVLTVAVHTPLREHHLLLLSLPMVVLGGVALGEILQMLLTLKSRPPKAQRAALLGLLFLALYLGQLLDAQAEVERDWAYLAKGGREKTAIEFLRRYTWPEDFIISDDQMLPFLAGRDVPPPLTDTSYTRLSGGHLPLEKLKALTEKYRPIATIFWAERFAWRPGYKEWVEEKYLTGHFYDDQHRIYYLPRLKSLPQEARPAGLRPEGQILGGKAKLLGYEVHPRPENVLHLTLYWQALEKMAQDYTVFVHLLDEEGKMTAQSDSQPAQELMPTSDWPPGEIIPDRHEISAPPGRYSILVGMYLLSTMERLPVAGAEGRDNISLGEVTIGR
ncbi:MAG: glycosyltransferase family 39 protein [Anaerolineae bacterium]